MTERIIKLYGPPGTGKTTVLNAQAQRSIERYGTDQVCALTFTRAAADELKVRIASGRGMRLPTDVRARKRYLDQSLPFVGTIHSLALRMTGGKVLSADDLKAFAAAQGGSLNGLAEEPDTYTWAEPGKDEVQAALTVYAASRHRLLPLDVAYDQMPWDYQGPPVSLERAARLVAEYTDYKRQVDKIDFEDMLERGLEVRPPVAEVLADEVQDNSPLLWKVVDHWSAGLRTALAGDPYQAIYLFSGAEPSLFINHPGVLRSLGDSRRLTQPSAENAQRLLREAGFRDEGWLETWTGVGSGGSTDGTEFYLARTGRLVQDVTGDLQDQGIPYGYTRGGGPLETRGAQAFRALVQLRSRGAATVEAVHAIAEACGPRALPHGTKARLKRMVDADASALLTAEQVQTEWGHRLDAEYLGIARGEYLERVFARHGLGAFLNPPRIRVGTIHSAKGKEADVVHLVDSWATLPYRNLDTPAGRRAEGCVAYVATTRHRAQLVKVWGSSGNPYPGL